LDGELDAEMAREGSRLQEGMKVSSSDALVWLRLDT